MDPRLKEAALSGDVAFLRHVIATKPSHYFLNRVTGVRDDQPAGNIFHLAALRGREGFVREAIQSLQPHVVQVLLCEKEPIIWANNPLHVAASMGRLKIIELILGFYRSPLFSPSSSNNKKPWLAQNWRRETPLHMALRHNKENCALEILSMDVEFLCNMVDIGGCSPILLAISHKLEGVALEILKYAPSYSVSSASGLNPFEFVPYCSEEVCRRLLERNPELIKATHKHGSALHRWVELSKLWPFEYLLKSDDIRPHWRKDFINLLSATDHINHDNPLHIAARCSNEGVIVKIVQLLVDAYKKQHEDQQLTLSLKDTTPWYVQNKIGETPLRLAIRTRHEQTAMSFLSLYMELPLLGFVKNPLFLAVENRCQRVVEKILTTAKQQPMQRKVLVYDDSGRNVLHAASKCTERDGAILVQKYPEFINEGDKNGKTPLDEAAKRGIAWLVKSLLKKDPAAIRSAPYAWVEACKRGHVSTIRAFIDNCPNFSSFCIHQIKDTPLHHIKIWTANDNKYQEFLDMPLIGEMMNALDSDNATPLHRALERKDIILARVLLTTDGVDRNIKDKNGKTAIDLLELLCEQDEEWDVMCERININTSVSVRSTNIQPILTRPAPCCNSVIICFCEIWRILPCT